MPSKISVVHFLHLLATFEKAHLATVSGTTRIRYQLDIDERIRPHFENLKPEEEIGPLRLELFRAVILKGLSAKSVNNCTDLLGLIFRKGIEWGLVESSPMKFKKLKLPAVRYSWWDDKADISNFLQRAKLTRYYGAYLIALETGLRIGEIIGLDKKDIDFELCQIHVHRQWSERLKKMIPPKGNKVRFVRFNPDSELRQVLEKLVTESPKSPALFSSSTGRRLFPKFLRAAQFPRLLKSAGVPPIRFHDLRHTFASWYMLEHDNIRDLQQILGHADIQTTQRYAHLSKRHAKAAFVNFSLAS